MAANCSQAGAYPGELTPDREPQMGTKACSELASIGLKSVRLFSLVHDHLPTRADLSSPGPDQAGSASSTITFLRAGAVSFVPDRVGHQTKP